MEDCITVSVQGAITIPAHLCEAFGIKPYDKLLVEPAGKGLLLRPVADAAIEIYSDDRIAEFSSDEAALGRFLPPTE